MVFDLVIDQKLSPGRIGHMTHSGVLLHLPEPYCLQIRVDRLKVAFDDLILVPRLLRRVQEYLLPEARPVW